ncbi:MAG: hypothetical protein JWN48_1596 [Myxococcaceae bacterium]|nr:hypothetical protein [Myxococcaceae bacterium]
MMARKRGTMNISGFSRGLFGCQLVLIGVLAGCGDDSGKSGETSQRSSVLNLSAGQIAQYALADAPNPEFVAARARVQKRVPTERVEYARAFNLGAGRSPITTDPTFGQVRVDAATALGTSIDPVKAADLTSANSALDTLLGQIVAINPSAASCAALPAPKNDACAFALIIIDVLRSEGLKADAGVTTGTDAGAGDAAVGDAAVRGPGSDAGAPVVPVNLFSCASRDTTGATTPAKATIDTSTTWSGKVLLKGDNYVTAGTLTIMPGTQIFMDVDATLDIGWNSSAPTLSAEGTPSAPILFCGTTGTPGFWDAVTIGNKVTTNSVLRNVLFSDGGGTDAALKLQGSVTADNVQVRNTRKDGVWAADFKSDSKALSVEGSGGEALVFTSEDALTRFPLGGMIVNNVANEAILRFTSYKNATVIHNIGVPYVQETGIDQTAGDLTFEAGVDYRFNTDTRLEIGWNSGTAGLHVNGTAAAPVKFGSSKPGLASWDGFWVNSKVTTNSNIAYAEFSQGGSLNGPVLQISAPVLLDHVTLTDNLVGASFKGPLAAGSKNLIITKTKGRPLTVVPDAMFTVPAGGSYTGNDIDQIAIDGASIKASGTIADLGVPWFFNESVDQYNGSSITVTPGTDFVMNSNVLLTIGWNSDKSSFIAKGTAAAPITFTGSMPTPGWWTGIQVVGSVVSTTAFDYVEVGHAGGGGGAALELKAPYPTTNTPVSVTHSKFYDSAGYGIISAKAVTSVDYTATNTFTACALGNAVTQ